jgi:tetratricopeptide (TPR) repeat protein
MKSIFALLLLCLATLAARADFTQDFAAANQLYAQGKFAEAAVKYGQILDSGLQSPALWFNDANAEFKSGHLGRAIAAYRHAALLAPRDAEVRANLQFVRNQVGGGTVTESRWRTWLGTLSLREWTGLTTALFWLTLVLLTLGQLRPALSARTRGLVWTGIWLTLFSGSALAVQGLGHYQHPTAVVTASTLARSGPFDDAQPTFTPKDGAELVVLDRHDNWVQVTDQAGHTGWLPLKWAAVLPGA